MCRIWTCKRDSRQLRNGRLQKGFRLKDLVLVGTMLRVVTSGALTDLSWVLASDGVRLSPSGIGCDKVRRDD